MAQHRSIDRRRLLQPAAAGATDVGLPRAARGQPPVVQAVRPRLERA